MVGEVVRSPAVDVVDGSYLTNNAESSFHAIGPRRIRYNGVQCKTLEPKLANVSLSVQGHRVSAVAMILNVTAKPTKHCDVIG